MREGTIDSLGLLRGTVRLAAHDPSWARAFETHAAAGEGSSGRLLVAERAPEVRTVHIHIVRYATQDWRDYVDFRDALLADEALRARYDAVKRELASRFAAERKAYTRAKEDFIRGVLSRASG